MAVTKNKKPSNRLLVPRLAAHVAHLMNEGEDCVELRAFALFQTLLQTLASEKYREGLIGAVTIGLADAPEQAALRYFEAVFERPLFLARANQLHKGHELFLTICHRGTATGWEACDLIRHNPPPENDPNAEPDDFSSVHDRLTKLDGTIAKGNPAIGTRGNYGPLYIVTGSVSAEVAEQMAVWGAIASGPLKLKKLHNKKEFDAFCSVMIKAVETANAPYGAFISLGLSPFDWAEELTTNTARMALRFINEARVLAEEKDLNGHHLSIWQQVWQRRKVPGFKTADELWNAELGRTLRNPIRPQFAQVDEFIDPADHDATLMAEDDLREAITFCEDDNLLSRFDGWFFQKVNDGWKIGELKDETEVENHFGHPPSDEQIEAYVDDLYERLLTHARSRSGDNEVV